MHTGIALLDAAITAAADKLAGACEHGGADGNAALVESNPRFFESNRQHALVQVPIRHRFPRST
jgi:hypothetical protein